MLTSQNETPRTAYINQRGRESGGNMEAPVVLTAFLVPQYHPAGCHRGYFAYLRTEKRLRLAIIEYRKNWRTRKKQAMLSNLAAHGP